MENAIRCPLCDESAENWANDYDSNHGIEGFICPRCGAFKMGEESVLSLNPRDSSNRRISTFTREATVEGTSIPLLTSFGTALKEGCPYRKVEMQEIISTHWPHGVGDRLNRALLNIGNLSRHLGEEVSLRDTDDALLYSSNDTEMQFLLESLAQVGLISQELSVVGKSQRIWRVVVLTSGWQRINEMQSASERAKTKRVFVAMWFDESLRSIFKDGIAPSVQDDCGFEPRRIDYKEYNDDVMAEVIAEIRASRFLIADLSGARRGVYFEAGFAKGLGLPVIFTCRKKDLKKAHFDVNHYNMVVWKDAADLRKNLTNRIRETIPGALLPS